MADKPFVINDRRKFTADGDLRPDAPPSEPRPPRATSADFADEFNSSSEHAKPKVESIADARPAAPTAAAVAEAPRGPQAVPAPSAAGPDEAPGDMPPPPTAEQCEQARAAYKATADRLETVIRANNPGMEPMPALSFIGVVQSVYMQAVMQLGGATEQGQQPRVDILGARQSIEMLEVLAARTAGNLSDEEHTLLLSAIFEVHIAFLEVTQALARQAAQKAGTPPPPNGPSLIR